MEDEQTTETPEDTTKTTQSSGGQQDSAEVKNGAGGDDGVTLSQRALNAMMGEAREQARSKQRTNMLQELGVESLEEVKDALETQRKAKEAAMTEQEKLQAEMVKLQTRFEALQAEHNATLAEYSQAQIMQAIRQDVAKSDRNIPADRIEVIVKLVDLAAIKTGEGKIDGVTEAVDAVLESNPFLANRLSGLGNHIPIPKPPAEKPQKPRRSYWS